MDRIEFRSISKQGLKKIYDSGHTVLYRTKDGRIIKTFSSEYIKFLKSINMDLENKILDSGVIDDVEEIVVPEDAVYNNGNFIGYTAPLIEGYNLAQFLGALTVG